MDVEKSLSEKKLCADDRKYIVRVLATVLLTHIQRPSKRQCEVVAKSLIRKFAFLKEYVSVHSIFFSPSDLYMHIYVEGNACFLI